MNESYKVLAIAISLSLGFPPGMVWAKANSSKVTVAVVDLDLPSELMSRQVRLRTAVANAFRRKGRVGLVPRKEINSWREREVQTSEPKDRSSEELAYARELLVRGRRDYEGFKFDEAIQNLKEARRIFIFNLPALRSNRDLIDTHLMLGMAYAVTKKEAEAKEEFRRVVYLDSKRELDRKKYAPSILKLFTEVQREVMKDSPIRVQVESSTKGASVFLNGRSMGVTPLEISLQAGEYFLLVEKSGLKPWYKPIVLKKRIETIRVSLKPEVENQNWGRHFRVRERGGQAGDDIALVRQLAQAVGSQIVFLGTLEKRGQYRLLGQLYDVRTSQFSRVAIVDLNPGLKGFGQDAQSLVDTLMELIQADGYVVSPNAPRLALPGEGLTVGAADRPNPMIMNAQEKKKAWYENWWIWPLVAGAGVGLYFGIKAASESDTSGGLVIDNGGNF